MKTVLISIFSAAVMLGTVAAQQDTSPASTPPANQTNPSQPSVPTPSQTPQAQMPRQQSPGAATGPAGALPRIAPGSILPVSLTKTIDAKKVKTGDEVVAKVTQDMKTNTGEVLVPKDTKVVGHVTESQARSKEQKESEIGIVFDRALMKNGSEMQMPMSIQAIIGQQNNQSNPSGGNGSSPEPGTAAGAPGGAGRASAVGGSSASPSSPPSGGTGNGTTDAQSASNSRPPINAQTQGVIGLSDLKLTSAPPATNQGSVVSSEKNNVKLESGTMMLLRVNQ